MKPMNDSEKKSLTILGAASAPAGNLPLRREIQSKAVCLISLTEKK